ncbi:hypothetical protein TNCV_4817511 [Trichonephila clavipes]|nr:hypothetical protein TNCV_4817511 [Trichonephila clavipes]
MIIREVVELAGAWSPLLLSVLLLAAFVQGTGINLLIPPSSVWCCHWPCVATWLMEVGGVSDAGTNGVEEGRLGEPSLPMEWELGVSIDSRLKVGYRKNIQWNWNCKWYFKRRKIL